MTSGDFRNDRGSDEPIAMRQRWRDLLFLHWAIPAADIQPLLPPGLIVDLYHDDAYIGLVPFLMRGVAPSWLAPVPIVSNLLECNVRTYVTREDGSAPGVWFFSLDASGLVAVATARTLFALPYFYAKMRQTERRVWKQPPDSPGVWAREVTYVSARHHPGAADAAFKVVYESSGGNAQAAPPGTLEEFLLERYTLYAYRSGSLHAGHVHHPIPIQWKRRGLFLWMKR